MKAFWLMVCWLGAVTAATAAGPAETAVETLPTLSKPPYAGKYAVYQHANFMAWLDAKGMLWVQPLASQKPVGVAFPCLCVAAYYNDLSGCPGRPIQKFEDPPAPAIIPATGGKVQLKGRLVEEIPFKVEYEFVGNTIRASGGCKDRPSTKPPTNFRLMASFGTLPMLNPKTATEAEIHAATRGMTLEVHRKTGKNQHQIIPYEDNVTELFGPFESMIVRGPFGPRVLTFKPSGREGALYGYIYTDFPPWQGFVVQYITQGKKFNLSQNEVRITIE